MAEKKNKFIVLAQFGEGSDIDAFIVEANNHHDAYHQVEIEYDLGSSFIVLNKMEVRKLSRKFLQILNNL